MPSVKGQVATVGERLEVVCEVFAESPLTRLTYGQLATVLGPDYSEDQVKSWGKAGRKIPLPAVLRIVALATERGIRDLTREWLEHGTGRRPEKGGVVPPGVAQERRSSGDRRQLLPPSALEGDGVAVRRQALLVRDALARVIQEHEVIGVDLRKVLGRMANGLDQLGHHEAAGELYRVVWQLSRLEAGTPDAEDQEEQRP